MSHRGGTGISEVTAAMIPDPYVPPDGNWNVTGDITASGDVEGGTLTSGGALVIAGAASGFTTLATSGLYTATLDSIGETSATADAAHLIISTTAASAGVQEYSPATIWGGSGWKTDATAASQTVRFMAQVIPVQGAAAPTGALHFLSDIADAGYTSRMNISSAGELTVSADAQTTHVFGQCALHNVADDFAYFSHYDQRASSSKFGVRCSTAGDTAINGSGALDFKISNVAKLALSTSALTFSVYADLDTTATITASTTQTQGQGALTAQINEVSTVANPDDTVTLPAAVAGRTITVINNGANTLQIFPASGDNLGAGADTSTKLEVNETVTFDAYDATNWKVAASTQIVHGEMHDEDNTDAFVVNDAGGDFHSYHTNGMAAGDLAGWTFDAGGAGTSHAISSIANAGGGDITVTTGTSHTLAVGAIVSQTNLADANYVGFFVVKTVPSATTYTVTATWGADGTGTMDEAATLTCVTGNAGVYNLSWWGSATSATNNETFDFQLVNNAAAITGTKVRRKFGTAGDFGSLSGGGVVSVADGDKLSFALSNGDTAGNITIRNLTLALSRL